MNLDWSQADLIPKGTNMKKAWLLMVIVALAASFGSSAQAQTPIPPLDHFRCYFVNPQNFGPVRLQDQFDAALPPPQQWENISQLTRARICNTVEKTFNGTVTTMTNVNHHLVMYQLNPQPIIPRIVIVSNQFNPPPTPQQTLYVSDARFLLVPTGKIFPPGPAPSPSADLDHYKCYAAGGTPINHVVALRDQFTLEAFVEVLWPVLFCNPVIKVHGPITTGIQNNRDHLTCYATSPSPFAGIPDPANSTSPAGVFIRNQMETSLIQVQKPDMLCVPSLKLRWSVVAQATSTTATAVSTKLK
jgi:hypothetical protein